MRRDELPAGGLEAMTDMLFPNALFDGYLTIRPAFLAPKRMFHVKQWLQTVGELL